MQKYIQPGRVIRTTLTADVTVGLVAIVGNIVGVALATGVTGATVQVATEGVFKLPKASGAISQGATVYWSTANSNVTTTATSNTKLGYAAEAVVSGDTEVDVRLVPSA